MSPPALTNWGQQSEKGRLRASSVLRSSGENSMQFVLCK